MTEGFDWVQKASEVEVSEGLLGVNTLTSISKRFIMPSLFGPPMSEAEIAAAREKREAEWDANTEKGLVGINDWGDDGESSYRRTERGHYADKWTTREAWDRYKAAYAALKEAEMDL